MSTLPDPVPPPDPSAAPKRIKVADLRLIKPQSTPSTPPCSPRSSPATPACRCEGAGTVYERRERAEAERLIIVDTYQVGDRALAVVPCSCAAGREIAHRWRSLPTEAAGVTLATLRAVPAQRAACEQIAAFVAQPRGWLILCGNYGTGKTKLTYACLNELADRGVFGRYALLPDLLDELRDSIKAGLYADKLGRIVRAPILAIDELDKFRDDSAWVGEVLEKLFITRYREAQFTGTILVYNRERADRLPPFLQSRITDSRFAFIDLAGRDLRPIAGTLAPWDRGEGES
jgi:DNA replication protein DnaC